MPFEFIDATQDKLTLRVTDPKTFQVVHGFRYRDQYDSDRLYTVGNDTDTDLASVPFFLQWLVLSYGRHTNAAIVHDVYWEGNDRAELRRANTAFRHAMWESDVPFLRRWFMWTAVTLAMLGKSKSWPRVAIWAAGLVTVPGAILASHDIVVSWSAAVWTLVVAAVLVGVAAVARKVRSTLGSVVTGVVEKAQLFVALGGAVLLLLSVVGHIDWVADHALLTSAVALVVGILAWGGLFVGGILATIEVAVILLPLLAIAVGLLLYVILEGGSYLLLAAGRAVKRRFNLKPVGTLNGLFSDRLETPAPGPEVKLEATQV